MTTDKPGSDYLAVYEDMGWRNFNDGCDRSAAPGPYAAEERAAWLRGWKKASKATDKPATGWAMDAAKQMLPDPYTTDFRKENAAIIQTAIDAATAALKADLTAAYTTLNDARELLEQARGLKQERDDARAAARELGESGRDLLKADDWLHAVAEEQDNHLTAISRKELESYSAWNWAQWSGARGKVREALTKHAAYAPDSEKDGE